MKFTRKGRHKLYALNGAAANFISEHNDPNEAYERAYVHAQAQINGVYKYRIIPAELELEVSTLARVVYDPDTTPPTTPIGVTATAQSQTVIRVAWSASTDSGGSGLAGYRVYRSATSSGTYTQIGSDLSVASLTYDDTGLSAGQTWHYKVLAFDGNANASSQSASVSATTQASSGGTTYGGFTPTIYANPTALGTGSGNSEANATTLTAALASATAGAVIGVLPGIYTHVASPAYRSNTPAWHPANSGTSGSPIRIVGKFNPTAMASPLSDASRTELRGGSGSYNGSDSHPVFGANGRDYIHWVNIVCNEANCVTKSDNGPAYTANSVGVVFERCVIHGADSALWADNHNCIRIGEGTASTSNTTVRGCILDNISNSTNDSNAACIMTYGAVNFLIENCEIFDAQSLLYIKGGGSGGTVNSGVVRYNYLHDGAFCRVQFTDTANRVDFYQNVFKSISNAGILLNQSCNSIRVYNNTFILDASIGNGAYLINGGASGSTGLHVRDNIFYATAGSRPFVNAGNLTAAWGNLSGNQYFNTLGSYGSAWSYNGSGYSSYASWVSGSGETGSINTDPGFVNFAGGNYRLTTPSGKGAYITGSETIGAR